MYLAHTRCPPHPRLFLELLVVGDPCDPFRDPLAGVGNPCDPQTQKKKIICFFFLYMDHTDYPFFTTDHGTDHTDHGVDSDRADDCNRDVCVSLSSITMKLTALAPQKLVLPPSSCRTSSARSFWLVQNCQSCSARFALTQRTAARSRAWKSSRLSSRSGTVSSNLPRSTFQAFSMAFRSCGHLG